MQIKDLFFYQSCKFSLLWYTKIKGDINLFLYLLSEWVSPCPTMTLPVLKVPHNCHDKNLDTSVQSASPDTLSLSLFLSLHTSQYPHCLKSPELYHTSQGFCALAYAGLLALLLASWNLPVVFPDPDQEFSPHGRPPWLLQLGVTDTSSSDTPVPATILSHREACHCLFTSLSCHMRTRKLLTPACSVLCMGPSTSQDLG